MIQMPVALALSNGLLGARIKGMKPIVLAKRTQHNYPETGEETISGIDMMTGHDVEIPTRYLSPIRQWNN